MAYSNARATSSTGCCRPISARERRRAGRAAAAACWRLDRGTGRRDRQATSASSTKTPSSRPASRGPCPISAIWSAPSRCSTRAASGDGDTAGELFRDLTGPSLEPPHRAAQPRRRRQDDLLPPPQGHAAHAGGAGARRHRLGGARGRVLRAPGLDAVGAQPPAPAGLRTPDIRSVERMDRLDGAFDEIAHTVDVRPIIAARGLAQHPQHRLLPVAARRLSAGARCRRAGSARRATSATTSARSATRRRCSRRQRREGDETGLATELHVPQPIRPARFFADIRSRLAPPPARFHRVLRPVRRLSPAF